MKRILRTAYRLAYGLGTLSIIASVVMGASLAAPSAALAGEGEAPRLKNCDPNGDHDPPPGAIITGIWVKAGNACFGEYTSNGTYEDDKNGSKACYKVTGMNTTSGTATKVGEGKGAICQDISHLEYRWKRGEEKKDFSVSDPCSDRCGTGPMSSTVRNTGDATIPGGSISWEVRFEGSLEKSGTYGSALGVDKTFDIDWDADKAGKWRVSVTLGETTKSETCEVLVCGEKETPTPPSKTTPPSETETPSAPQSTPEAGVFIPVTGVSIIEGGQSATAYLQNAGFGLLGLGLVLQGISLRADRKKEDN